MGGREPASSNPRDGHGGTVQDGCESLSSGAAPFLEVWRLGQGQIRAAGRDRRNPTSEEEPLPPRTLRGNAPEVGRRRGRHLHGRARGSTGFAELYAGSCKRGFGPLLSSLRSLVLLASHARISNLQPGGELDGLQN